MRSLPPKNKTIDPQFDLVHIIGDEIEALLCKPITQMLYSDLLASANYIGPLPRQEQLLGNGPTSRLIPNAPTDHPSHMLPFGIPPSFVATKKLETQHSKSEQVRHPIINIRPPPPQSKSH
jgi:hypothetical protein